MVEITPLVACGNREVLYTVRVHPYNVGKRAVGWESSVNNLLITEMVMGIKAQKTRLTPGRTASLVNLYGILPLPALPEGVCVVDQNGKQADGEGELLLAELAVRRESRAAGA